VGRSNLVNILTQKRTQELALLQLWAASSATTAALAMSSAPLVQLEPSDLLKFNLDVKDSKVVSFSLYLHLVDILTIILIFLSIIRI
jgi:hypothetical protein